MDKIRLQKYLASCGVASRRSSEKLILEGRVKVNDKVVRELGVKVDPDNDYVKLDNKIVKQSQLKRYIMLNKPLSVVTTVADEMSRKTVIDLVKVKERVYPVGRLDFNTTGLVLLTNDGDLTYKLTHPSKGVWKKYVVEVEGYISDDNINELKNGIMLEDGLTSKSRCNLIYRTKQKSKIEVSIHEGRNRQIRRMFEAISKKVLALSRTEIHNLKLKNLSLGEWRDLTKEEVLALKKV